MLNYTEVSQLNANIIKVGSSQSSILEAGIDGMPNDGQ